MALTKTDYLKTANKFNNTEPTSAPFRPDRVGCIAPGSKVSVPHHYLQAGFDIVHYPSMAVKATFTKQESIKKLAELLAGCYISDILREPDKYWGFYVWYNKEKEKVEFELVSQDEVYRPCSGKAFIRLDLK